jgi:hypothetical protein
MSTTLVRGNGLHEGKVTCLNQAELCLVNVCLPDDFGSIRAQTFYIDKTEFRGLITFFSVYALAAGQAFAYALMQCGIVISYLEGGLRGPCGGPFGAARTPRPARDFPES